MVVVKLRWRKLKSGARSYYLDYHLNGARKREFLKLHLKYHDSLDREELLRLAKEAQRAKTHDLTSKDLGIDSSIQGERSFTKHFKTYIDDYLGKDQRKLRACLKHLKAFLSKIDRTDIKTRELSKEFQKEFKNYLSSSLGGETVKSYMGVLRKVIRGEQFSPKDIPEDTLAKQILTDKEIAHLSKTYCGNDEVKRAFLLACFTGFGLAECKELEWKHIFDHKIVLRRRKSGVELNIPVLDSTLKLLGNRGKEGKIFELPSSNGANKVIKHWVARADISKRITFYCARHSYAVRLLNEGTDLQTLRHLMGHKGTRHLAKYLNHIDTTKRKAIEKLPRLDIQ